MKVSSIVITYNNFDYIERCINSLYKQSGITIEIIVVDNSPDDARLRKILKKHKSIIYIHNSTNVGFGEAANIGLKFAKGNVVIILNSDVEVLPDTIPSCLQYFAENRDLAIVACAIYSKTGVLQQSVYKEFPNLLSHLYEYNYIILKVSRLIFKNYDPTLFSTEEHEKEQSIKHTIGAFFMIRTNALKSVGLFDKKFFLYREETDVCKRLYQAGWKLKYKPSKGGVIHIGAASTKTKFTQSSSDYMESTYMYFWKYHGKLYTIAAWSIGLLSALMSLIYFWLMFFFKKKSRNRFLELMRAWSQIICWHLSKGLYFIISL